MTTMKNTMTKKTTSTSESPDRFNINYKVDGKPACLVCNPIVSCCDGTICDECFAWLKED